MTLHQNEHYRGKMIRAGFIDAVICRLVCLAPGCSFQTADRAVYRRPGDRSGLEGYGRMRAAMVRHWHATHLRGGAAPTRVMLTPALGRADRPCARRSASPREG